MNFITKLIGNQKESIVGLNVLRTIAILIVVYEQGKPLLPLKCQSNYTNFNFLRIDGISIFLF